MVTLMNHRLMMDQDTPLSCGQLITRKISMQQGCTGEDCNRRFQVYFPTSVCNKTDKSSTSSIGILPLVFSVHCAGCSLETFHFFMDIAEEYQFVWVNPEGLHNSFNAGDESCCGYALEKGVDDKAFLMAIIQELTTQNAFVSVDWVYGLGWSNGGYMVSAAADLFRAIAPIAGYHIEKLPLGRPTALFLHHALDDTFVQATGCCTDSSMPQCCCHISQHLDTCLSVESQVTRWATNNACSSSSKTISFHIADEITCYTYDSCLANTTYCIHEHKGHFNRPSFQTAFSYSRQIADFFANHMCITGNTGAIWDSSQRLCHCPHTFQEQPIYCTTGSSSSPTTSESLSDPEMKNTFVPDITSTGTRGGPIISLLTVSLATCLGLGIWYLRSKRVLFAGDGFLSSKQHGATRQPRDSRYVELAVRNL